MSATPTLDPRIVGQAEYAHLAVLEHILTGTGLDRTDWVLLTLTGTPPTPGPSIVPGGGASGGGDAPGIAREHLVTRAASALKQPAPALAVRVDALVATGWLTGTTTVALTESGRARHEQLHARLSGVVGQAYAEIPADELVVAGRVLTRITARLDAALAELTATA